MDIISRQKQKLNFTVPIKKRQRYLINIFLMDFLADKCLLCILTIPFYVHFKCNIASLLLMTTLTH